MIVHAPGVDSTLALMRRGYPFIAQTCDRLGTDAFRTRLLGRSVVCARGAEAARLFYTPGRFGRRGAMPSSTLHLLQDEGSVQTLDGPEHRHRKALFLAAIPQGDGGTLVDQFRDQWHLAVERWSGRERVALLPELEEVLTRTATAWAGLPMSDGGIRSRTAEMSAMVRRAGSVGPANWWARALRRRSEAWATASVRDARTGALPVPPGSPLHLVAFHREVDGALLPPPIAGVELLNLIRPVVAVARFVTFAALALVTHPRWHRRFGGGDGDGDELTCFVQEVRRSYPFFPLIGGRALERFGWLGHDFAPGAWMVLDLYGTNHDARLWPQPEVFDPERFHHWDGDPDTLVPQGGGEVTIGHRCPGENATIALMAEAVRLLTRTIDYEVPVQDLGIDLRRMPAQPRDGFVIERVRAR